MKSLAERNAPARDFLCLFIGRRKAVNENFSVLLHG